MNKDIVMHEFDNDYLVSLFLDIGEALLYSGAEINRVEDTISRLGKAYGAVDIEIFALTSLIVLSVDFGDGKAVTQTRRIISGGQTDFIKIQKLNSLSRKCCKTALSREELREEIDKINKESIYKYRTYLGSILGASGFTIFFGGDLFDALVSGIFVILICLISDLLSSRIPNKVFYYFVTSLIIGFGICLTAKFIPSLSADKIIIGDIMVLVPGVALTTAVKNVIIGDTLSALVRFAECLVWTCALAFGFMIPISILFGG